MKKHSRKIPLFSVGRVEFHNDRATALKSMGKVQGVDMDGMAECLDASDGCCVYTGYDKRGAVFFLCCFSDRPGVLAHEAFHTALRILSYVNAPVRMDEPNETMAYLIEWLVDNFHRGHD